MHRRILFVNRDRTERQLMHQCIQGRVVMVADDFAKLRDFLWEQCEPRRKFWIRSSQRPNACALALEAKVNPTTITRILQLDRGTLEGDHRKRPLRAYSMSPELHTALSTVFKIAEEDLLLAIRHSKPAPPLTTKPKPIRKRNPRK